MKNKFASLLAASAFAGSVVAHATPAEEISERYIADVQTAVSAYFNTLNIPVTQIREGLTIPWVSTSPAKVWYGAPYNYPAAGYAVATGSKAANGCPVFRVVVFDHRAGITSRSDANFSICP